MSRLELLGKRGQDRIKRLMAMVQDKYLEEPETLTFAEMVREYEKTGHVPPGENCQSAICMKARRMYETAMQTIRSDANGAG